MVQLKEATYDDAETLAGFITAMADELCYVDYDQEKARRSIASSFNENVHWFLFLDEEQKPFGTCHCQSLYNYWREEKRFYLGAFYISPEYREKGRFKLLNAQLQNWVSARGGVEIYAHIHKDNEKSLASFASVGMAQTDYVISSLTFGN